MFSPAMLLKRLPLLFVICLSLFSTRAVAQIGFPPPPPPPGPPPVNALQKLDPLVLQRVSLTSGRSRVIVRAQNAASMGLVATIIQQTGGTLGRVLSILDARAADVPNTSLLALANNSAVARIALDRAIAGANERTAHTVGATAVREQLGFDGTGIRVAVIDSGIASSHDDLRDGSGAQRVDQFVDFVNGDPSAYDDYGHGTHVAGIIAGNGFDSDGARTGIAPGARLVVLKALDGSGHGRISDVIAAFDYVVTHNDVLNVRVINLSVGSGVYESYNADLLTLAAKRAVDAGIVVVAAAGNAGRNAQGNTQYGGITAPGNAPWVLTVGASSHMGTIDRSDDTIAAFSSRGPTAYDRTAKPDLVAPGVGIESLADPNSSMYVTRSQYLLPGTVSTSYLPYLNMSGTSMAAPVVAGTVALMLQANPLLTPNAVKAILEYTAQPYAGYDALTQGAGFLSARGAVDAARALAVSPGNSGPPASDWGQQLIWGNRRVQGGVLSASGNAWGAGVTWGTQPSSGSNLVWGAICSAGDCEGGVGTWTAWGTAGSGDSPNVVWGSACGGADCPGDSWSAQTNGAWGTGGDDTVVWGTTGDDTVVWGTTGDDTVVWGTTCDDSSCDVSWGGQ
jgi:serine protease AprX